MAVLKPDSALPPLPDSVLKGPDALPPAVEPKNDLNVDTPPGIEAHRAEKIISDPAAVLGVGPVAPKRRRIASRWQKAKYVVHPTLITPLKVGAVGTLGFVAVGGLYGGVAAAAVGTGMLAGFVGAGFVMPPVVGMVAAVGVVRSISRLFTSRAALTDIMEKRRQKKLLKDHNIPTKKAKKRGFR